MNNSDSSEGYLIVVACIFIAVLFIQVSDDLFEDIIPNVRLLLLLQNSFSLLEVVKVISGQVDSRTSLT